MRPPILKVFPGPAIPTGLTVATGPKTRKPAGRGTTSSSPFPDSVSPTGVVGFFFRAVCGAPSTLLHFSTFCNIHLSHL
jgi:hypothetical protein